MATMRLIATTAIVLVMMGLSGCGGDEPSPATRAQDPARVGAPSRAEIERFGRIELPASASGLRAKEEVGLDTSMAVSFTMDRSELQSFIDSAQFTEPPRPGRRAVASDKELGWKIEAIDRLLGHSELQNALGRRILIDLDRPARPVVYFEATTI